MKYLSILVLAVSLPTSALAADALYLRPTYPDQTSYFTANPWSRPYIGIFGGVASANHHYAIAVPGASAEADITGGGLQGGIRAGYDYTTGDMLIGGVLEASLTNVKAGLSGGLTVGAYSVNGNIESKVSALMNVKARLGFTQKNNLFYVHGGPSFAKVDITERGNKIPGIIEATRIGYTLGAGYERVLTEAATFQTEYSFTNLGKNDIYSFPPNLSEEIAFHAVTAGVNFRF